MDELCCRSMASELLLPQRVSSGLANLTEIVMRARSAQEDPSLSRTMITLRDDAGQEFDCEVRAVASGDDPFGVVVCGLRRVGERRAVVQEDGGEGSSIPSNQSPMGEEPGQGSVVPV